jgi:hypothetical protein
MSGFFVDAVAVTRVAAQVGFSHAGVDDVGIGVGDGDGADRTELELAIGDGVPVDAAVGGLEDAAAGCAEVEGHGLRLHAGDGSHTAAPEGTDLPEGDAGIGLGFLRGRGGVSAGALRDEWNRSAQQKKRKSEGACTSAKCRAAADGSGAVIGRHREDPFWCSRYSAGLLADLSQTLGPSRCSRGQDM